MRQILLHPYAGVLSAYGIGLADIRVLKEEAIELPLTAVNLANLATRFDRLATLAQPEIAAQGVASAYQTLDRQIYLRYAGTDAPLLIDFDPDLAIVRTQFETLYRQRYGFTMAHSFYDDRIDRRRSCGRDATPCRTTDLIPSNHSPHPTFPSISAP